MATDVPMTRLERLNVRLDNYMASEAKILEAQQYQVGDGETARELLRARLDHVQAGIREVEGLISVETAATTGRRGIIHLR